MNIKNRIKTIFTVVATVLVFFTAANAATVTISATPPTADGEDISNLSGTYRDGALIWNDRPVAGQTFLTVGAVQLNAFTVKLGSDVGAGNRTYNIRVGTINVSDKSFSEIYSETGDQNAELLSGEYMTFEFDAPVQLAPDTVYGLDVGLIYSQNGWQQGIPKFERVFADEFSYADGDHYSSGSAGVGGLTIILDTTRDLTFHLDMEGASSTLPEVEAGSDWVTWSGASVTLDDVVVVNNSDPVADLIYSWSADPADGVVFSATDVESPTVTITKATENPSVVTLTLAVNNVGSSNPDVTDSMAIEVYDDSCKAALALGTAVSFDTSDFNHDCITNMADFAEMALAWLVDYSLTAPAVK